MNQDEYEVAFKRSLNANINDRLEKSKEDLIYSANERYKSYFNSRNKLIDYSDLQHWLWYYLTPGITKSRGKDVGFLQFTRNSNLPHEMKVFFRAILYKHFPKGDSIPVLMNITS